MLNNNYKIIKVKSKKKMLNNSYEIIKVKSKNSFYFYRKNYFKNCK